MKIKFDRSVMRFFLIQDGRKTKLFPQSAQLLYGVMCHPLLTWELGVELLWPNPDTMPEGFRSALTQVVGHLRHSMRGSGWAVEGVWGVGWRLVKQ